MRIKVTNASRFLVVLTALACSLAAAKMCGQASSVVSPHIIVADSAVSNPTSGDYAEFARKVRALETQNCRDGHRKMGHSTTADLVGGKVKDIRIVRSLQFQNASVHVDPAKTVQDVWRRSTDYADCSVMWDEMVMWSIEASVEFEDGKSGILFTDGVHVAVQDHDGEVWFFRLLPAQ